MIAAKAFDPVVGVDIHIIQPPGPVPPIPVPHPFIGILLDPFDFAPIIGSTVSVNGLPRATAGTGGRCLPPHIPIGGVFVKPPANECDVFMGSSTVLADDEPLSFLGMPALSCHCIGMPPFPRLKKKRSVKSLVLPTTFVLAIPMGMPVLVGGPPTVSMMALGMKAGMALLGKAFKKLKKLQKASRRMKAISDKIQNAAKKAMNKLGVPPSVQNKVSRAICSVTGHPVDVATGKVFTDAIDFELPGPVPLRWERVYYTSSSYSGPFGHGWHHNYDMALLDDGDVVVVRLGDGRSVAFAPLADGAEAFDRQEQLTLLRDDRGYAVRDADSRTWRFAAIFGVDHAQPLVQVRNQLGHGIEFHYQADRRLASIRDSGGRTLRCDHDAAGRIVAVWAPHPEREGEDVALVRYEYDGSGDLVTVLDAVNAPTRYRYADHLLVQETDRIGLSFNFEYRAIDSAWRCVRTWGDEGLLGRSLSYDMVAQTTTVVDSVGATRVHHWTSLGIVEVEIDATAARWQTIWDDDARRLASVDPLGQTTSYAYDDRGNEIAIQFPDGSAYAFRHDSRDQPTEIVDRRGGLWLFSYDDAGRLVSRTDPTGRSTRFRYTAGFVTELVEASGTTRIDYDTGGNVAAIVYPDGRSARWTHDRLGRPTAVVDSLGRAEQRTYDLLGRVVRVEDGTGVVREFAYDGEHATVEVRDNYTRLRMPHGALGTIRARAEGGVEARFEYDSENRPVALVNEQGERYSFLLNLHGLPQRQRAFDGQEMAYEFDAARRVTRIVHSDQAWSAWTFDPMGRITGTEWRDGTVASLAYDAAGQTARAANATTVVGYRRDPAGRVVREQQDDAWIATTYDDGGRVIAIETSLGLLQRIERDTLGRPVTIRAIVDGELRWTAEYVYAADGSVIGNYPGGVRTTWQYDAYSRPLRHAVAVRDRTERTREYVWGAELRLQELRDSHRGPRRFEYDEFDRLAGVHTADGAFYPHRMDAVGNLVLSGREGFRTYGAAGEILSTDSSAYRYDGRGRRIEKRDPLGSWRYEWLDSGMLARVVCPDGRVVEFEYDALGRRVAKTADGARWRWLWNQNVPVHEWRGRPGTADATPPAPDRVTAWVYDPDGGTPLAKIEGGIAYTIVTDHLGTPLSLWDGDGNRQWFAELGLRGEWVEGSTDRGRCPLRHPGQYDDLETGLYYNRFRYYDPEAGSYISQDPLRLEGGGAFYGYVYNPMVASDPLGLHVVTATFQEKGSSVVEPVTGPRGGPKIRSDPGARSIPGRTGDSEQKVLARLEETKTPGELKGSTVKITSEGDVIRLPDGRVVRASPLKPCDDCQEAMKDFTRRHKSTIEYKAGDATFNFKNGKMTKCG